MAFKVIRRGCVTDDYLDDLAVVLQSIRCGTGWQRFLVFAELTKSKKKVSWIALFVYFQRKGMLFHVWRRRASFRVPARNRYGSIPGDPPKKLPTN